MGTNRISEDNMLYLPVENKMLETAIALTLFFAKKNILVHAYHASGGLSERTVYGLEQFDAFYEAFSAVEFRDDVSEEMLLTQASARPEIFRCKTVFLVLHEWTPQALEMARLLHENNVFAVAYLVRDDIPENLPGSQLPGVEIVCIRTDDDLTEVM